MTTPAILFFVFLLLQLSQCASQYPPYYLPLDVYPLPTHPTLTNWRFVGDMNDISGHNTSMFFFADGFGVFYFPDTKTSSSVFTTGTFSPPEDKYFDEYLCITRLSGETEDSILIFQNPDDFTLTVYSNLSLGNSSFATPTTYSFSNTSYPGIPGVPESVKLSCGDFDNDGQVDLAIFFSDPLSYHISYYRGPIDLAGSYPSILELDEIALTGDIHELQFINFDGIGNHELLHVNSSGYTMQIIYNANITDAFSVTNIGGYSFSVQIGDFNGDGKDDVLFIPSGPSNKYILFGHTQFSYFFNGSYYDTIDLHSTFNSTFLISLPWPYYPTPTRDFNGDGFQDLSFGTKIIFGNDPLFKENFVYPEDSFYELTLFGETVPLDFKFIRGTQHIEFADHISYSSADKFYITRTAPLSHDGICDPGYFLNTTGYCTSCPPTTTTETYNPQENIEPSCTASPISCSAGSYIQVENNHGTCTPCQLSSSIGQYNPVTGQSFTCDLVLPSCSTNEDLIISSDGSTYCQCKTNFFNPTGTACIPCPPGAVCNQTTLMCMFGLYQSGLSCLPCPPGRLCFFNQIQGCPPYFTENELLECVPCPPGTNCTTLECYPGYYKPSSSDPCQVCPFGAVCNGNGTLPVCAPGFFQIPIVDTFNDPCRICLNGTNCTQFYDDITINIDGALHNISLDLETFVNSSLASASDHTPTISDSTQTFEAAAPYIYAGAIILGAISVGSCLFTLKTKNHYDQQLIHSKTRNQHQHSHTRRQSSAPKSHTPTNQNRLSDPQLSNVHHTPGYKYPSHHHTTSYTQSSGAELFGSVSSFDALRPPTPETDDF